MKPCDPKLSNELAALKAEFVAFKELMQERHDRYDERDEANKERVADAFKAAEKAGAETKEGLVEYKKGANEWRDTVKDLIGSLRESLSTRVATGHGMEKLWGWIAAGVMAAITVFGIYPRK